MSRLLSLFLDQLAERFAALTARLISSRVEGMQAVAQAEQQSELEDLARRYEQEGKLEIAATLRQRALALNSPDLAAEGIAVLRQTAGEPPRLEMPTASNLPGLPQFTVPKPKTRTKGVKPLPHTPTGPTSSENFPPSLPGEQS